MLLRLQDPHPGQFLRTSFILANEPAFETNYELFQRHMPFLSKLQFNFKIFHFELRKPGKFPPSIDLNLSNYQSPEYQMKLVYGYAETNYAFILKREKVNGQQTKTKLGRLVVDENDEQYSYGYVELPLTCKDPYSGETFTHAESAHFGTGDSSILMGDPNHFPKSTPDDTLFVTFNKGSKGSLLCAFLQKKLNEEFDRTMIAHYSAVNQSSARQNSLSYDDDEYVESLENVKGRFVFKLKDQVITSLASTVRRTNRFVFGTKQGEVRGLVRLNGTLKSEIKFSLKDQPKRFYWGESSNLEIRGNPLVDGDHAYFSTSHRLVRVPLADKECTGPRLNDSEALRNVMGKKSIFNEVRMFNTLFKHCLWSQISIHFLINFCVSF